MRERRVVVDLSSVLRRDGGAGVGLRRLTAGLGRLKEVHDTIARGVADARWPHLRLPEPARLLELAVTVGEMRERARGLAVVGEPAALAPLRAIVDTLAPDCAFGLEGRPVAWVGSPDPGYLERLDRPDVAWLVLEGPAWTDDVAEWAVGRDRAVAVAGDGEHTTPPGGWWVSDDVAGHGCLGGMGPASLLCAAWAGADVAALVAGARDMAVVCQRAALLENPAYSLALAAIAIEQDLRLTVPAVLVQSARLESFGRWFSRMWGSVRSSSRIVDGVRHHHGSPGVSGVLGDEALLQALFAGVREHVAILWEVDEEPAPGLPPQEGALQARVFLRLWERELLPALRVRLPRLDATSLGGAMVLGSHAAVTAALFADHDPLSTDGPTAWRDAVDVAREEAAAVDGGEKTA